MDNLYKTGLLFCGVTLFLWVRYEALCVMGAGVGWCFAPVMLALVTLANTVCHKKGCRPFPVQTASVHSTNAD